MNQTRTFHSILLLFGAFAIDFNLAIAFHELGHATAVIINGGQIQEFVLNPFSWSWSLGGDVRDILFTAWGGVTIGLGYTLVPLFYMRFAKTNNTRLVIKLLAGLGFLMNGIYLIFGVLFNVGDGGELVSLGVSSLLIWAMGIVYVLIALWIWSEVQRFLGIDPRESFFCRLLVLTAGIAPYMALIVLYNYLFNPEQLFLWGGFACAGVVLSGMFAICGYQYSRGTFKDFYPVNITGLNALIMFSIGTLVILAEFLIFGTPQHPF